MYVVSLDARSGERQLLVTIRPGEFTIITPAQAPQKTIRAQSFEFAVGGRGSIRREGDQLHSDPVRRIERPPQLNTGSP